MTRYHSSRSCQWVEPRPHRDASLRFMQHGPIQPMRDERGLLARLLGRRA